MLLNHLRTLKVIRLPNYPTNKICLTFARLTQHKSVIFSIFIYVCEFFYSTKLLNGIISSDTGHKKFWKKKCKMEAVWHFITWSTKWRLEGELKLRFWYDNSTPQRRVKLSFTRKTKLCYLVIDENILIFFYFHNINIIENHKWDS